jgi:nitroimidazol reductase NimA-like FMN-containing flavoprotein (pyridoxamine 5'-phosphate oxidase superfamily)
MSTDEVHAYLDSRPGWMQFTTIGRDGYPHTVPIGFFRIGDSVYTGGRATTQRARNIARNPRVSALFETGGSMEDIKGVLLQGDAEMVTEPSEVLELIREAARQRGIAEDELPQETPADASYIRLTPRRTISWDYSKEG